MAEAGLQDVAGRTVGELVTEDYRRAEVFARFGVDFCCGGERTVAAACDAAGADAGALASALGELERAGGEARADTGRWELDALARHIVDTHHAYVRETSPLLLRLSATVAGVHGASHPELAQMRVLITDLTDELAAHMEKEEQFLFPRVEALAEARRAPESARAGGATSPVDEDAIRGPLSALEDDHALAGELTARLRELSGGYAPPEDACGSYRLLYAKLEEFESDLHRHVHLENNVLFPGALSLARTLAGAEA